jgi:hypothetical protein
MKCIVTHQSVDIDSITSCWLIKRFLPGWDDTELKFVPAGSTLDNKPVDSIPSVIHVDTGFGKFDHHQTDLYTSASKLVYGFLVQKEHISRKFQKPLEKLITIVNESDHFGEVFYPDASSDRFDFLLSQIIEGLKGPVGDDRKITEMVCILLDAIFQIFKNKVKAEEAIIKGFIFQSTWGRSLAMESKNEEAVKLALKQGFQLVIKKDPDRGNARIKTRPEKKLDLTPLHDEIKKYDTKGTWFLHVSKHMLLNSSSKNPNFIPTSLSLQRLIEITRGI